MARRRSDSTPYDSINLTPLIDTLFFLLIIFMVTAPLLEYSVDVSPPELNANQLPQNDDEKAKIVNLKANGVVVYDSTEMTRKEFLGMIGNIDPEMKLFLRGDRTLTYGEVMDFLAGIKRAGFTNIHLVTAEEAKAQ